MASFNKIIAYMILGLAASVYATPMSEDSTCEVTHDSVKLLQSGQAVKLEDTQRVIGAHAPRHEDTRHLQNFHATAYNRYPSIFTLLKELVDKDTVGRPAKLLSFGCSYGDECHSLRDYFPDAHIHGVDISVPVIEKAKANNTDPLISFFTDTAQLESESYDAVLAMGVLCHQGSSNTDSLTSERFSQAAGIIDRLVRPGGLFVLYNADHTFDVYPRHASFENVCTGSTIMGEPEAQVAAGGTEVVDMKYAWEKLGIDATSRGRCASGNKFCVESGWVPKQNAQGMVVQEAFVGLTDADRSYGCRFPGPFFKKKDSILTETN